jgi:hypothetical protein
MMANEEKIQFKGADLPTFTERGFQPILALFCSKLDNYQMDFLDTLEGKSVKLLSEGLDLPFMKGFFRPYKLEKCEKICLCNCILMDRILVSTLLCIPDDDYDLPMLVLEWSETEDVVSILADFIPVADPVITKGYRAKYLDPLDDNWMKYKVLPWMEFNRFAWSRMLFSPYYVCGRFPKESEQDVKQGLEIIQHYLDLWLDLRQKAEPIKDDSTKALIKRRKDSIRQTFKDNDEGAKTMLQMVGQETIDLLLLCNF